MERVLIRLECVACGNIMPVVLPRTKKELIRCPCGKKMPFDIISYSIEDGGLF